MRTPHNIKSEMRFWSDISFLHCLPEDISIYKVLQVKFVPFLA